MFDLKDYLTKRRAEVEAALEDLLPAATIEPTILHEAMRYAVFTGGKRLRPILSMAAAEACGSEAEGGLLPGCAVEILHTYTLVHDDLPCMDDDDERRGKPTVHVSFGETNAVLAGDALQALAFELVGRTPPTDLWNASDMVRELAVAAGSRGVVGGQVADLGLSGRQPSEEEIAFIHEHKTADLFRASLRLGGMAANGSPAQVEALGRYALNLGLAFQITDDLLDAPETGASPDEASVLSVVDPDAAHERANALIDEAVMALSACDASGSEALRAIASYVPGRTH
ncbi:MAG: polyprenyl synthetase family protein [Kiritimatiellae bacterium]|nr:polyprenyl synthetase family protein [Kiritimatiellia bacterium]